MPGLASNKTVSRDKEGHNRLIMVGQAAEYIYHKYVFPQSSATQIYKASYIRCKRERETQE